MVGGGGGCSVICCLFYTLGLVNLQAFIVFFLFCFFNETRFAVEIHIAY